MAFNPNYKERFFCSLCGHEITMDSERSPPIGTVIATTNMGFFNNRVFCNQREFDEFYEANPEERD